MKATLVFNLPEEEEESHKDALSGSLYKFVLQDLDNDLRSQLKHGNLPAKIHQQVQDIRDKLHSLCTDRDINIWG